MSEQRQAILLWGVFVVLLFHMTTKTIEQYGSREAARAAFKDVSLKNLETAFDTLGKTGKVQRTSATTFYNQIARTDFTPSDIAGMTDREITRSIRGVGEAGIKAIDKALVVSLGIVSSDP